MTHAVCACLLRTYTDLVAVTRRFSVHLLATGDAQGAVQIWNLATEYVSPKSYELTELNRLGSVQSDI